MKKTTIALAFLLGTSIVLDRGTPTIFERAAAQTPDVARMTPVTPEVVLPTDTERSLQRIDDGLRFEEARAQSTPGWTPYRNIARLHLGRARLVGTATDYAAADRAMARAFDHADQGTGPFLARASLNMTMHRVDEVEADLRRFERRIVIKSDERARVHGLRGDVSMQLGRLDRAMEHYLRAEELDPTMSSAARIGNLKLKTGRYDEARHWYEQARLRTRPGTLQRAWALLHLGIVELDSNNVGETMTWYRQANSEFSGWYLVEEHIAESMLLRGDVDAAIDIYLDVLERVPNGEFYAALADAYDAKGESGKAEQARADALAAFERDIAVAPTAVTGHAIDFFISTDPARGVQLARDNFEMRPGPESRTKFAQALLAHGEASKAVTVLRPALDTGWATVDYLATAALTFAKTDPVVAAQARARVEAVDPDAVREMADWLRL